MKILSFDQNKSVDVLTQELETAGISKRRLSEANGASFLPRIGKFEAYGIDGDTGKNEDGSSKIVDGKPVQSTVHVRIGTKNMLDSISLSRLQINLHVGNPTMESLRETRDGSFFLPGNTIVNPALQGNQANAIKKLMGKWFVSEEVIGVGTAYVEGGLKDRDAVEFRPIKAFKVHTFDTETEAKTFAEALKPAEA